MKKTASLFAALLLAFAMPAVAQVDVGDTFKNFTPLNTPQGDVPIGALWLPGTGPSGDGTEAANIRISKGANSSTVTKDLKRNLGLSLGSFLGLSASQASKLKVELSGIEVHRVRDLTRLNVAAGQQAILAAIKADTVSLTGDQATTAQLKANAQAKGVPIVADVGGNNTRTLQLGGSDLFLAYQVVEFRPSGSPKQKVYRHKGKEFTVDQTYKFDFCRCGPGNAIKIYVTNLKAPTPAGTFQTEMIESQDRSGYWKEVGLNRFLRGQELTAASAKISFNSACTETGITNQEGKSVCFATFPQDDNYVRLITTSMKIVPVKNPSGGF